MSVCEVKDRPPTLTCLECKAFGVEAGYDGYYPGDFTFIDIGCAKGLWRLDNEDVHQTFERYMRTAVKCEQFEPKQ